MVRYYKFLCENVHLFSLSVASVVMFWWSESFVECKTLVKWNILCNSYSLSTLCYLLGCIWPWWILSAEEGRNRVGFKDDFPKDEMCRPWFWVGKGILLWLSVSLRYSCWITYSWILAIYVLHGTIPIWCSIRSFMFGRPIKDENMPMFLTEEQTNVSFRS